MVSQAAFHIHTTNYCQRTIMVTVWLGRKISTQTAMGLSKSTPQLPNNTLSNNPSDCPDSATWNKVTSNLTHFTSVCVHVCRVLSFQTGPALASIALDSRAEPTLDFEELGQVIGERGGDRSGGRGMKMSLIRAGRERQTLWDDMKTSELR